MGNRQIGNYRLIDYVGSGGFGSVFKAEDISNPGRIVAVKELHKKHTRSTSIKQRFFQEAVAMARLDHPNLPRLYTFGEDNGSYYLVMEFVSGRLLSEEIVESGRIAPDRAVSIIIQVLEAISYAHKNGIIHRDLKPENIIITQDSESLSVKVFDFGISKMIGGENLTLTGEGFGTPAYMSPERIIGSPNIDLRTDIYSAGIILCEMLTGKAPFGSNATDPAVFWSEMRSQHELAPLPLLTPFGVGADLEAVIKKAAAKKTDDRYSTADEMLEELRGGKPSANLLLVSQPGLADVYVDNILRGTTDPMTGRISIPAITGGIHNIKVSKQGFTSYKIDLSLDQHRETELQVQLAARPTVAIPSRIEETAPVDAVTKKTPGGEQLKTAVLVIDSLPVGSSVTVGADAVAVVNAEGHATVMLPEGSHDIEVMSPSGAIRKERITVGINEVGATKTISLPFIVDRRPRPNNLTTYTSQTKAKKRAALSAAVVLVLALSAAGYFIIRAPGRHAVATTSPEQVSPDQGAVPDLKMSAPPNENSSTQPEQTPAKDKNSNSRASSNQEEKPLKADSKNNEATATNSKPEEKPLVVPQPPSRPTEQSAQQAEPEPGAREGCVAVLVQDPGGQPIRRIRVVIVEGPGTSSSNVTEGRTGMNGRFHTCGLTPGKTLRVTVLGPAGGILGSKQSVVPKGRELIVIQAAGRFDNESGQGMDRRRSPWKRP